MNFNPPDPILSLLLRQNIVSGEDCAHALGISRAAVHKRVEKLRATGWLIEASTNRGFQLQPPYPHALIPEQIASSLSIPLLFTENSSSTNQVAKTMSDKAPCVLMTRAQLQGKGRAGRTWDMQADRDLAFSVIYQSSLPITKLFSIIRLAAIAVHSVLKEYGVECLIKWPNDIITPDGKKICGILTENMSVETHSHTLIIGIGINGNSTNLPSYATSIAEILAKEVNINELASTIINKLMGLLQNFPQNEEETTTTWQENLAWVGETVSFTSGDTTHTGIFEGCTPEGGVILIIDGRTQPFFSGDLSSVKLRRG
ncbi:MAG: biotin--[acetyl-CoA-carboxylase] ligase [Brevinema sp.]